MSSRDLTSCKSLDSKSFAKGIIFNESDPNVSKIKKLVFVHHDVLRKNVGHLNQGLIRTGKCIDTFDYNQSFLLYPNQSNFPF